MKIFDSEVLNISYFLYRMILPLIDPIRFVKGIYGYLWYTRDLIHFKMNNTNTPLVGLNMYPILDEKSSFTPFDAHYFYQEIWAYKHLLKSKPKLHIDIGSKYQFSGFVSLITHSEFIDIRPIRTNLVNLTVKKADVLQLPYKSNSVSSLSSLHVLEHIGLGRYGDPIDSEGTLKAIQEIIRVLKKGGYFYISLPIGKYRICFNAHRIHTPQMIVDYCSGLKLIDFSVVDDVGAYSENVDYHKYSKLHYGCGMFRFKKL